MEPLGAVASVITLLQLIHKVTILCLDARSRFKNATPDLVQLINGVKALRGILEGLLDLNVQDQTHLRQLKALASSHGLLTTYSTELGDLERWLQKALLSNGSTFGALKWTLQEKEINRRLHPISRLKSTLQLGLSIDNTQLQLGTHLATLSLARSVEQRHEDQHRRTILDWLTAQSPRIGTNDPPNPGDGSTGSWFLNGATFKEWTSSLQSILWLHGIPGSGKSVLCASIVETLLRPGSSERLPLVLQFFFDFNNSDRQDVTALLCSLIAQVQNKNATALPPLGLLHASYVNKLQGPNEQELLETLREILSHEKVTYIIIDGIDECGARGKILRLVADMSEWIMAQLHLLIASRKEADIERAFRHIPYHECSMKAEDVNEDIGRYVQQSIEEDSRLIRWPTEIRSEIVDAIALKGCEMFRWAACQLQAVKQWRNLKGLRNTLKCLPTTLEGTYARILDQIDTVYIAEAKKLLMWLCFAARPLTIDEVIEALAIDLEQKDYDETQRIEDPEDIMTLCGSLTTYDHGYLKLAHYSVKEYLTSDRLLCMLQSTYFASNLNSDHSIAQYCLLYLRHFDHIHQEKTNLRTCFPLFDYCIKLWHFHYMLADRPPDLTTPALENLEDSSSTTATMAWQASSSTSPLLEPESTTITGEINFLRYTATTGCTDLIDVVLDRVVDIDAAEWLNGTALSVATFQEHHQSVELLLRRGADVNSKAGIWGTALHVALFRGQSHIAKLLISYGADVN
ncbi:hypothetical protein BU23DRAFT_377125, partial [Bimuria novae-zelandiae CBS 107.79]